MSDIENYDWLGLLKSTVDVATNGIADNDVAEKRYEHCKSCVFFKKSTTQCKKCGCVMKAKVKVKGASCPIGIW